MKKNIELIRCSHGIGLETAKILGPDHQVITASRTSDNSKALAAEYVAGFRVNVIAPSLTGGLSTLNIT